jgi:hypothetical protein
MNIKRFDPVIYPQKLWVCVGKDFESLNGLFSDIDDNKDVDFGKFGMFKAVTLNIREKKTQEYCVVIVFRPKYLDCNTIAHEASHAAGYMFHHIGADMDCGEPTAYLIGYIADCCWKVKTSKKQ